MSKMKSTAYSALILLGVWLASYTYMLAIFGHENFFVPSFALILSALAFIISPRQKPDAFFKNLRFGRAFYSILLPGVFALFGGNGSFPNWAVIPPLFGAYLVTSALVDRMDKKIEKE